MFSDIVYSMSVFIQKGFIVNFSDFKDWIYDEYCDFEEQKEDYDFNALIYELRCVHNAYSYLTRLSNSNDAEYNKFIVSIGKHL